MILLIESGTLDVAVTAEALRRTFDRRATHSIPAAAGISADRLDCAV
jgi:hypothetical protein